MPCTLIRATNDYTPGGHAGGAKQAPNPRISRVFKRLSVDHAVEVSARFLVDHDRRMGIAVPAEERCQAMIPTNHRKGLSINGSCVNHQAMIHLRTGSADAMNLLFLEPKREKS